MERSYGVRVNICPENQNQGKITNAFLGDLRRSVN